MMTSMILIVILLLATACPRRLHHPLKLSLLKTKMMTSYTMPPPCRLNPQHQLVRLPVITHPDIGHGVP